MQRAFALSSAATTMRRSEHPARRWALSLTVSAALGCGGRDIHLGDGPVAPDAGVTEDAGTFSLPTPLTELAAGDASDDDPVLSSDRRLLYFNSERDGGLGKEDIWFSERATVGEKFGAPVPASTLNSEARETGIALSADGLAIWFSSDRAGGRGGLDVYAAARATRASDWSSPELVLELSSANDDLVSAIDDSATVIYLARRGLDEDDYDLFTARRDDVGAAWMAPQAIAALNSGASESDAFSFARGLALVFTRDEDLVLARRTSVRESFALVEPLHDLNSPEDDRDAWVSDDFRHIVFSSNRSGAYRLYEAHR